jgi:hypothetical protein
MVEAVGVALVRAVQIVCLGGCVALRGSEVDIVFDGLLLLASLLDARQFALDAGLLGLRQRASLAGLREVGVRAEEIVDAHRGDLHLLLVDGGCHLHQNAVFEESADHLSANQVDLSLPVLHAALPLTLVEGPVSPEHLPVSLAPVLHEVPLVEVAAREVQLAVPFLQSFRVAARVLCLAGGPLALTVAQSIAEASLVGGPTPPDIAAEAIKAVVLVVSAVDVPVSKQLLAAAMLQRVHQSALEDRPAGPQYPPSVHDAQFPLPHVGSLPLDVEAALVAQAVEEAAAISPLAVDHLQPVLCLEIVGKDALEPANAGLHIRPPTFPTILAHQSLVGVSILANHDGSALAAALQELPHIELVRANADNLEAVLHRPHLGDELAVELTVDFEEAV